MSARRCIPAVLAMAACHALTCLAQPAAPPIAQPTTPPITLPTLQPTPHSGAQPPMQLSASTDEPRAFGWQIGAVVSRHISVHAPDGLVLDEAGVPQPGGRGKALELRRIARSTANVPGGLRLEMTLDYQVMLSPAQTRTLEMPSFVLHFEGQPRPQDLRIEAWPLVVSPLAPVDASPRHGLGELRPDTAPPLIDTAAAQHRLSAYGALIVAGLSYLAWVYLGLPWWRSGRRPLTLAWRALRGLRDDSPQPQWRAALRRLHGALNQTAGEVVFEGGLDRFVNAQPRFKPLRADLGEFFQLSRQEFFATSGKSIIERAWLIEFARRCSIAERGAA